MEKSAFLHMQKTMARREKTCLQCFSWFKCFYDYALTELVNHYANRTLFLVLRITPKSRAKVCAQWRVLNSPGSLLATDCSKVVVLV